MTRLATLLLATAALAACDRPGADAPVANSAAAAEDTRLTLTRLDCGNATIKDFDAFFSDRPGLYAKGPREITDSCYLVRRGGKAMIWDTGFAAGLKGGSRDMGHLVARLGATVAEQLAQVGLKPADIDIVGISHLHPDHTGQAAQFANARLVIGKGDFEQTWARTTPSARGAATARR